MNRLTVSLAWPMRKLKSVPTGNTVAYVSVPDSRLDKSTERPAARGTITKSAIESLILKNYTGLRLLIMRRIGDPNIAADLLSEAICITWEKWQANEIERPDQIAGYIFRVAVNLLRNHRRSMSERREARADVSQLDALATEDQSRDSWIEQQMAAQVKRIIKGMSTTRDRIILTRFYLDEEDKDSICRDLALDSLQFDKVLHRARTRLRELLESQGFKQSDIFSVLLVM